MMEKLRDFEKMLTNIDNRIKSVNEELKKLPKGALCLEKRRGKSVHVYSHYENGKRMRASIEKDIDMQSRIIKSQVLVKELRALENNRKQILNLIAHYSPFDVDRSLFEIEKKYNCDATKLLQHYTRYYDEISTWASEYTPPNYMSEERKHRTTRGLYVRSKSEALIAEQLYIHNIAFRYEQPKLINGIAYYPDFTIMRSDGKEFFWEHAGLTNSKTYNDKLIGKIQMYGNADIYPWKNLILTYDEDGGVIDIRRVEFEIQNRLIV